MKQIDERGNACPIPVVHTKKALESMDGETKLVVLVDNEPAVQNVTRFAEAAILRNLIATAEEIASEGSSTRLTSSSAVLSPNRFVR